MATTQAATTVDKKDASLDLPDLHPLDREMRMFSSNLRSLRGFVDLLEPVLQQRQTEIVKANRRGFELLEAGRRKLSRDGGRSPEKADPPGAEVELVEGREDAFLIKASQQDIDSFLHATREINHINYQMGLLFESSLMTLISIVEVFLSSIIRYHFKTVPEVLGDTGSFTLKELQGFDTIADARAYLIDRKLEDSMRGSFEDWIAVFKQKLQLSMSYLDEPKSKLVEACQRRNLLVHNRGVVNAIYMSKTDRALTKNLSKGMHLSVDREYLDEVVDLFERSCILVAAEAWKKLEPEEDGRAACLGDIAYDYLCDKRFSLAEALSKFMIADKKMPEGILLAAQMNFWLSLKRQGRFESIKKEVEQANFSAKDLRFRLAHASLIDDASTFYDLLPHGLAAKSLSMEDLARVWL